MKATTLTSQRAGTLLLHRKLGQEKLRAHVLEGLPVEAFDSLRTTLEVDAGRLCRVLMIPERTLVRRRTAGKLKADESDRLYRLARIVAQAAEVLGSMEKARAWVTSPNRTLAGEIPLDHLQTDLGSREVEDLLLRVSFGIFS